MMLHRSGRPAVLPAVFGVALLTGVAASAATAKPGYKLDPGKTRVVEMTNLAPTAYTCAGGGTKQGRVAEREVDQVDNRRLYGFFLSGDDATEYYVEPSTEGVAESELGWLLKGYETLLKTGASVRIGFKMCEVAGTKSPYLDSVR